MDLRVRKRIERGIAKRYKVAVGLLFDAWERRVGGDAIGYRACLELVASHRDAIADARLSLRLDRLVQAGEARSGHLAAMNRRKVAKWAREARTT